MKEEKEIIVKSGIVGKLAQMLILFRLKKSIQESPSSSDCEGTIFGQERAPLVGPIATES